MEWLQRLHLVDAPPGTTLRAASLSLRGLFPVWLAALVLVACAAGAYFLYARETVRLGPARRLTLAGLRVALIALVLAMLLRPVLLAEFHGERPRPVVLLIDNTESMKLADRRLSPSDRLRAAIVLGLASPTAKVGEVSPPMEKYPTRADLVRGALSNDQLRLLERLRGRGPVQPFFFAKGLTSPPEGADLAEALREGLKADGGRTALADAVHEVLTRTGAEPPAAVVVVSDGRDNASSRTLDEAARACAERGVPLHVYGVGSSEAGLLHLKDAAVPKTVFVDPRKDVKDDAVEVPLRWRLRGFKKATVVVTLRLGEQVVTREFPAREGEDVRETVRFVPDKGKEGERAFRATVEVKGQPDTRDEVRKAVQVKGSRVKVLVVENTPRRDYQFLRNVLIRDRRVLARFYQVEGDPEAAKGKPDDESGAMFVEAFPDAFPDPPADDPDRRPFDLLVLGDVPLKALGKNGPKAIRQFVKEGGGLLCVAGRNHGPSEYAGTPLAEVLPVEFTRQDFEAAPAEKALPYKPALTYDGEQSAMLLLEDDPEESARLWKEKLWEFAPGFHWHYPVTGLRPGAVALAVHPTKKVGPKHAEKPMPLVAAHHYGKGEVLFVGFDETWLWRDGTGDKYTARLWGQVVGQLGLPHLVGNARRTLLDLVGAEAVLGRPGAVKARLLDPKYEPLTRPEVRAALVHLDAADGAARSRPLALKRVGGQPGEYRATLPHDAPGRWEVRVAEGQGLDAGTLPYRVELPPAHELEPAGMEEAALRAAAVTSGGKFYTEEDLHRLPDDIVPQSASFVQRQEVLLWNPLTMVLFIALVTAEWVLRKFSNLS